MKHPKLIGGFFGLELPFLPLTGNLAKHWQLPANPALRFRNARSALAALMTAIQPKKAWLPAYVCDSIVQAFIKSDILIDYYAVGDQLEPDVGQLDKICQKGDVVLAINYFGKPPSELFINFVKNHRDLIFIEDCAQSIDSGENPWGDWRLFSPRKVVGVADGGFIIPNHLAVQYQLSSSVFQDDTIDHWAATLLRYEGEEKSHNQHWHLAHQQREKTMTVSDARMSRLSHELLWCMSAADIIQQRKLNFMALYKQLSKLAFLPIAKPNFCPFGFPIRLPCDLRAAVNDELIKKDLFPAIHWLTLPSPQNQFVKEHQLAKEILTLPCDHRYNTKDMDYLATIVLHIIEKQI